MIYYIADTHFGHANVIKHDNRPFDSVDEMDRVLIENWNNRVNKTDEIYIIGDLQFRTHKQADYYLKQLNGRKHLIIGNHDTQLLKDTEVKKYFVEINQMSFVLDNERRVIMCHYPLVEWNGFFRGAYHIYGHVHNNKENRANKIMSNIDRALNAGCMLNDYMPVTLDELIVNNKNNK